MHGLSHSVCGGMHCLYVTDFCNLRATLLHDSHETGSHFVPNRTCHALAQHFYGPDMSLAGALCDSSPRQRHSPILTCIPC